VTAGGITCRRRMGSAPAAIVTGALWPGAASWSGHSPVAALVRDHLAVVGQAAGRDHPHLAAQLGDRLQRRGDCVRRFGPLTFGHEHHGVLLAVAPDYESQPAKLGMA